MHSQPHNNQTVMEQHPQHRGGMIHVFGPKIFLSDGDLRLLQIHENFIGLISGMDKETI